MTRPPIPPQLRDMMRELGLRWRENISANVRAMIEQFSALLSSAPSDTAADVKRGVAYGTHPRQQIDIFSPRERKKNGPALLFVHGGAFLDGDRNRSTEIYSNVLIYFARHGILGVNIGYRLAGDVSYPGATQDVGAAVEWVRVHAEELQIDPNKIFLMGHSAGCAHAGSYAYDRRLHPAAGPGVCGLIVVSGRVRADVCADNPNAAKVATYYGTSDEKKLEDVSPVSHVSAKSVPTFVAWGEWENPLIDVHCAELVFRLGQAKRRTPPTLWLQGHNHTSTIAHFNTAEDALGRAILAFIEDPH